MSDMINEAAEALLPIVSAGAGVVARDAAERAGVQVSEALAHVLERIRSQFSTKEPRLGDVESALRASLDAGQLTRQDLRTLIDHRESIRAKNVFTGTTIIKGDFHA